MRYNEHIQTKQNSLAENHMSKVTHLKATKNTPYGVFLNSKPKKLSMRLQ